MATIHVNRAGSNLGTFSEEDLRAGLRSGRFLGSDLGWREGMATWQPLSQFSEFAADAAAAVPPSSETAPPISTAVMSAAVPEPTDRTGLPWGQRQTKGFFNAFFETVMMVLTKPDTAFRIMKREGGLGEPILYAVIGGSIGAIIAVGFSLMMQAIGISTSSRGGLGYLGILGTGSIFLIILIPVFVVVGLFIGAAVVHLCLMIVGGARQPFETTVRVLAFTHGSTGILQIVPICGGFIAAIWGLVVACIGLARAHEIDTGKAVLAILLPFILCCGIWVCGIFMLLPMMHHAMR